MEKRIQSLDGLRAVSILLVIVSHETFTAGFPQNWGRYLVWGGLGVRVFFVISGYLITSIILAEIDKTGRLNIKRFYYRRTLRIFPPFYFFLLIMGILHLQGYADFGLGDFIHAI